MQEAPVVTIALAALIDEAGGVERLVEPRGYPHLGVAIVDAVFSLRADYDSTVVPLLQRYCDASGLGWSRRFDPTEPRHGARQLLEFLGGVPPAGRCALLNHQVAPGTHERKADVCVEIARALVALEIGSTEEFAESVGRSPAAERSVRSIRGVGPAAWSYLLNLSRVERSKPDTMVVRWIAGVTGQPTTQSAAAAAVEEGVRALAPSHPGLTVRKADHLIWRAASGRPLVG